VSKKRTSFFEQSFFVLIDLITNLMSWRSFGDNDVSGVADDGNPVGIEELTVAFAALAELELETSLLVEDLK
jgi:hypothetical protein